MEDSMARATAALADALAGLGWDGTPSSLGVEVQMPNGTHLGRVEVHVRPFAAVVREGTAYEVTPTAFLAALRGTEAVDGRDRL
jgi:hypothetical protein